MSLYMYHCWQVQDLLGCLEFDPTQRNCATVSTHLTRSVAVLRWNLGEKTRGLKRRVPFPDLLPEEVAQLVTILGTAYGRKIACTPRPPGRPRPRTPLGVLCNYCAPRFAPPGGR